MPKSINNLLLFGGIAGAAALGFLFFTEPGKDILRKIEQDYYVPRLYASGNKQRIAEGEARFQKTGYY